MHSKSKIHCHNIEIDFRDSVSRQIDKTSMLVYNKKVWSLCEVPVISSSANLLQALREPAKFMHKFLLKC